MGQNWSNICCQIKQFCLPLTSILTVGVVSFITKTYLIDYLPPLKKVIDTKSPMHNDLVKYTLSNGIEITSTFDHPYYVNKMELASFKPTLTNERYQLNTNVRKIQKGDCVYMIPKSGIGMHAVAIEKIETQPLVDTQTYIFTVEDNHNFYANGILVHNK